MNNRLLTASAALLLGALAVLGFAPFELFPLALLSQAGLFWLWRHADSPRQAAWLGGLWGAGFFLCGVSWVYISLHVVGGMHAAVALAATLFLCGALALYPALTGATFHRLQCGTPIRDALLITGLWTLTEWLRGWLLTGFPWLAIGYAHTPPSPLAGFAAVSGVYGVSLAATLIAALIAAGLTRDLPRRSRLGALLILLPLVGSGALLARMDWTQPVGPPITVSLLQGNIPQESKWDAERVPYSLLTYAELLKQYPADLTVMPETALPMFLEDVPREYLDFLMRHGPVLTGVALTARTAERPQGYLNAALALAGPTGTEPALQTYAKHHLVPFGEYIPYGFGWFVALMKMPMSDFSSGAASQPPLQLAGQQIAANICYEDLFGEEIIRALPQATILANLSNTAWFGDSLAQPQHLQIARLRAMETGRVMLRATNTGMTAAIGPDGQIIAALPAFTTGGLLVKVHGYNGSTPFVRWGNRLALLLAIGALLPALIRRRRSPHSQP
jgi:apolipoprotein N-acyltransferase